MGKEYRRGCRDWPEESERVGVIMKARTSPVLGLMVFLLSLPTCLWGAAQTVRMPVTLDYAFLRSMFVTQAYTQPGERAVPVDRDNGCTRIELWQPDVGPEQSLLKLGSNIKIRAGLPVSGTCIPLADWEGYIEALQRITLDPKSMRLGFETQEIRTFNQDRSRTTIDRFLSELIRTHLNPYLTRLNIDLAGPVRGLQGLLPLFFAEQDRARAQSWLGTLRLSPFQVGAQAIGLDLLMDIETAPEARGPAGASVPQSELTRFVKAWEDWDAFSVHQVEPLVGQLVTEDERNGVLETLLDTRYDFVQAFAEGTLDPDLIRRQFTTTWQGLAPVLRKYMTKQPARSLLSQLAFLTASDALVALDRAGPAANLNISRDGLVGLARLLGGPGAEPSLSYSYGVNRDLRGLFDLGPALDETGPAFDSLEIELPEEPRQGMIPGSKWSWLTLLPGSAFAAEGLSPSQAEIEQWLLPKGDINPYLKRINLALDQAATQVLTKSQLDEKYRPLFRLLVLSTAWQETCWRQFTRTGGKVRSMLSYNQTSVGLMQINERVWRGIYRPENLRWNISYNARAGCEILELYLRRYALRRPESKTMDSDTLARAVYAMYNGGPGQFPKLLTRSKNNTFYKSDQLFWEKYAWAKAGHLDKLSVCLIGR